MFVMSIINRNAASEVMRVAQVLLRYAQGARRDVLRYAAMRVMFGVSAQPVLLMARVCSA